MLQHRAIYPGGLTFVGAADGLLGSRYHRVFLWRAPGYTDALPELTVYIEDQPYALTALTPELFTGLGGTQNEGGLYDSESTVLRYRFEGGKLTWFSLDAERAVPREPGGNVKHGVFALSRGKAPGVTLPASLDRLRDAVGPPERTTLVFVQ